MKAETTCGGSVIEPRGHSLTLHQHSALLKALRAVCVRGQKHWVVFWEEIYTIFFSLMVFFYLFPLQRLFYTFWDHLTQAEQFKK